MINTITLNPSLDYIVKVDDFKVGHVNRTSKEDIYPGGKGINVSIVLKNLGVKNRALGFTAGFTGEEIEKLVANHGVDNEFIRLEKGMSRINVKLKSKEESEINGMGPDISKNDIEKLYEKLEALKAGDFVVLAGSIPNTLPDDIYETIMKDFKDKEINFVVDATKDLLLNVLKYKPFLIKPNHHELGEMFNVKLNSKDEIITYAKKLQEIGARNVIISMAGDGAILIEENGEITISDTPKGTLVNSVGAGDSMVGGFLAGIAENKNIKEAFKIGVATGSASAFSEGLATRDKVEELLKQL
ncbi:MULTISPECIES: 1-phosphofructokinase [Clostridia]|uniref:Tagatose-6-phosphate kinase n=2 Tax=Clostridia TaxID=186801 RepID=A0A8I0DNM8_9CLOT|nr:MULTISPECIES: 1-phosphofructokinase [Clostridia]MBC5640584.1 1-phosphofructokinase [Clostridium lentum]MBC5654894.1 1-phosphofructokinase [Blautia lenta]MEE0567360.1 1-phosphofructokinase [Clostridium sp.]OKZ86306.1 MAG: 1-phosphofructokinase [Clostridium sp. 29_15]CDB75288.1 1-phosphofructokinase [Clostridium sp. CAG:265]